VITALGPDSRASRSPATWGLPRNLAVLRALAELTDRHCGPYDYAARGLGAWIQQILEETGPEPPAPQRPRCIPRRGLEDLQEVISEAAPPEGRPVSPPQDLVHVRPCNPVQHVANYQRDLDATPLEPQERRERLEWQIRRVEKRLAQVHAGLTAAGHADSGRGR
jgi:hypothetical protein